MLPAAHSEGPYRIALVCLGNICRSPIADVVLNAKLAEAGLGELVVADSYGTGDWHVGDPMDKRAAAVLTQHNYDATRHRARQFPTAGTDHDLVLAMDADNLNDLGGETERTRLFRTFDPEPGDGMVPDPYYGGDDGFALVLRMIERTSDALVEQIAATVEGSRLP
ncbi:low molecular weight protein-tyrosine-phosphatase [Nocardioides sp. Bht2]|uniref:low molecular weight protein-tyrosine-phosphatase n=1 Tax=Nocardioides sp. Bht2 TaxID=3392297 RepID=UPI0039B64611